MSNKPCRAAEIAETIAGFFREVKSTYELNYDAVSKHDQEIGDLRHYIEFFEHDDATKMQIYQDLESAFRQRRKVKDENETMQVLYALFEKKEAQKFLNDLSNVLGQVRSAVKKQEKRQYRPRIRKDLDFDRVRVNINEALSNEAFNIDSCSNAKEECKI